MTVWSRVRRVRVLATAAVATVLVGAALVAPGVAQQSRAATVPSGPAYDTALLSTASLQSTQVSLVALSCTDPTYCVAVGTYTPTSTGPTTTYPQPLIETYEGGGWTAYTPAVPNLPNSGGMAPNGATLAGVSCTGVGACEAIGNEQFYPTNEATVLQYGFSETLAGPTWTPTFLPDQPAGSTKTGNAVTMGAISCLGPSSCVAVGSYVVDEADQGGLAYTLTPAGWSDPDIDVDPGLEYSIDLSGVSCVSVSSCVAVGGFKKALTPAGYPQEPLAETLTSGTWTTTLETNPTGGTDGALAGVSCSSAVHCEAVGTYTNGAGDTAALAEGLIGTTWTAKTALVTGVTDSGLASVSCDPSGGCTAVGDEAPAASDPPVTHLLVLTLSGSGFVSTFPDDPGGATDPAFSAVSCPAQGSCVGVGNASLGQGALGPIYATEQAAPPTQLVVTIQPTAGVGHAVAASVTAVDASGALASSFDGTVDLTSSDPTDTLPAQITLVDGGGAFTVVFSRPGVVTLTGTIASDPAVSGSAVVTVNSGPVVTVPSPPQGLTAEGTVGGISLHWYPPSSNGGSQVTGYVVERGTAAGHEQPIGLVDALAYTDTTPQGGVRYYYVVEAVNRAGRSGPSNEVSSFATGNLAGGRRFTSTPDGKGYWLATPSGGVFTYGDAGFYGSLGSVQLAQPIVSMVATPDGRGYWLVASDGGVFAFGDAGFHGSLGAVQLVQPIIGMAGTRTGHGYWLVAADGGIFSFGDARFYGSLGAVHLVQPIVGMAAAPSGNGYWLVASDGGIFSFGGAHFAGSLGNVDLIEPIVGMASAPDGDGYWLVASDGGIFCFGDARFYGSLGAQLIPQPILGMIAGINGNGYQIVNESGVAVQFGG